MLGNVLSRNETEANVMSQIARLRGQIEELARANMKPDLESINCPSMRSVRDSMASIRSRGEDMVETVQKRPLTSVAAIGIFAFFLGRITR